MATLQVTIADTNLYTTFGMYVTDYKISPPVVKTHYVEIPFRNGALDLTSKVGLRYEDREIEIVFYKKLTHDQLPLFLQQMNLIFNGAKKHITFSNDSSYYYIGRPMIEDYEMVGKSLVMLKAKAKIEPYKYDSEGNGVL